MKISEVAIGRVLRGMYRGALDAFVRDDFGGVARRAVTLPHRSVPKLDSVSSFSAAAFWGANDPLRFQGALDILAEEAPHGLHAADNLVTIGRNNSMFDDQLFVQAWQANLESDIDKAVVWRRYVLACAAFHCVQLDGDFVECGANAGVGVKTVIDYLGGKQFPKQFWAYDLFEHNAEMINHAMPQHGPGLFARVQASFRAMSRCM